MVRLLAWLCAIQLAGWLAWIAPAHAQASAGEAQAATGAEAARTLFVAGVEHTQQRRWPEAESAFRASLALLERPSTLYNLAITLLHRNRPSEALQRLEQFQRCADPRVNARELAAVPELQQRAEAMLATLLMRISPADAELWLDEGERPEQGPERTLRLDPGEHVLRFQRAGYETHSLQLVLLSGTRSYQILSLRELEPARSDAALAPLATARLASAAEEPIAPAPRAPARRSERTWVSKWWVWTAAALVVGGVVTGAVLLAQRESGAEKTEVPQLVVKDTRP